MFEITVLKILPKVGTGIERGISDSQSGVLTTRPRCLQRVSKLVFLKGREWGGGGGGYCN